MTNSNTSILIVGIVAAALLCGSAVAVIAIVSTNDDGMSNEQREFYAGYRDGYNQAMSEKTDNTLMNSNFKLADEVKVGSDMDVLKNTFTDSLQVMNKVTKLSAYEEGYNCGYSDGSNGEDYRADYAYSWYCGNFELNAIREPVAATVAQAPCSEA